MQLVALSTPLDAWAILNGQLCTEKRGSQQEVDGFAALCDDDSLGSSEGVPNEAA
jgi:hypothetical protein